MIKTVLIGDDDITIDDLVQIARFNWKIELTNNAKSKVGQARKTVEKFLDDNKVVYGITTGVGDNSKIKIPKASSNLLQKNLIRSHACGVGDPLREELVRAVMVMMIKNLSLGYSGVHVETIQRLIDLLNNKITPKVPEGGSLGYLSYQAHISLVLIGEGEAYYKGNLYDSKEILENTHTQPLELQEKEGLSLINGTVDMTALGAVAVYDAINLMKISDISSMLSFESLRGAKLAFDYRLSKVKKYSGMSSTLKNINLLLEGSEIAEKSKELRTQDALSSRAIPQVHGACKDTLNYVKDGIEVEMNSASDNPLIFSDENDSISSANCHGESVSMGLDFLAIALSEISNISDRRIFRLVSSQYSDLPPFLAENSGINSGYMIPQYVSASLAANNKHLAQPASVDSIPTAANQEDHHSMGTSSALKLIKSIANTRKVLAIEIMCGCQGLDYLKPLKPGHSLQLVYDLVREDVPMLENDRILYQDINLVECMLVENSILNYLEKKSGNLSI